MSIRTTQIRFIRMLSFGLLAMTLLVATPLLWTAHSSDNIGKGTPRFAAGRYANIAATQERDKAKSRSFGNLDVRVNGTGMTAKLARLGSPAIARKAQAQAITIQQGLSRLKEKVPSLDAKTSQLTGAVEVLRSANSLTGPHPGRAGTDIVRDFMQANKDIYGLADDDVATLNFMGESLNRVSGLRMVRVEQVINGLPVFQSETRFIVDREGRVIRSTGLLIPQATAVALPLDQLISAQQALQSAMYSVEINLDVAQMSLSGSNVDGTRTEVVTSDSQIAGNVNSKLVYFPVAPGVLLPAWSQITFTNQNADWYTLVNATNGELLWRKNIRDNVSTHDARFRVYVQADGKTPADSPAPLSPTTATTGSGLQGTAIAPTIVSMLAAQNITASPNGWINDCPAGGCTITETQTIGNNVHAYMDRQGGANANLPDTNAGGVLDGSGKPTGNPDANTRNRDFLGTTPRDFQTNYLPPPQAGNAEAGQTASGAGSNGTLPVDQYRRAMITQLFYVTNWYHDRLFLLGFDEAAGNFQQTNPSGMGLGADRVLAEGQDSTSVDNANFSTPPDGQSGRAQMYLFTGPTIDRDGSLDSEVLMHELSHGTSNRLIGNAAGLNWDVGAGMGEGWSDYYALSLLNNTNADDPNGKYASGAYATYKLGGTLTYTDNYLYGIRRFPYSTNNAINPMTWADVDDTTTNYSGGIPISPLGFEFNGGMEVHNIGEIWCLTLWEVRSRIIAANANDVPTGNNKMLSIVTDGLKMTPISPSFTDARNALIDADCAANACANEPSIWGGFADRGLGYNAIAPLGISIHLAASTHMGIGESFSAPYLDVQSVTVNDSLGNNNGSIDPGEAIKIVVKLKNPWRQASKGVASATATLTSSTAGVVIQDGNSTYPAIAAQGSADGDTFRFAVPANATCGQSLKFTITPNSTLGSHAVDFVLRVGASAGNGAPVTYTHSPAVAIPDGDSRGVIDSLTITDDFEIADLNFRVDSLTHAFPGDLSVMLKAPNGYGGDMVSLMGWGLVNFGTDGPNLTNMVIDDQAPVANDMLLATPADAPYTRSWVPIFNSPSWTPLYSPTDPVGQLSRLNGTSTQGTWKVLAADWGTPDAGILNAWSIIVTPKAFTCTPPVPTAANSTISGRIADTNGSPLAGVVINLSGTQSRKTITDAEGAYRFDNVESNGFYSVTPSLVNYHFSPANRSFSLVGNKTDATFTATEDAVVVANAIDTSEYFVRQQYLDFLGREPEAGGFNYWNEQVNACNGDADCIRSRRIDVSAAFFMSQEFKDTGSFVYRLYKGALGRQLRYAEFSADRAQVVGGPNLEASKAALADAFVQRAEFADKYQADTTAEAFVDALLQTMNDSAGVNLSSERDALINRYHDGASMATSRALVVRQLIDNETFASAVYNQSFVTMQYMGYLRRTPETEGFNFWVNVLNSQPDNYRGMICSFITSSEYQRRFSTVVSHSNTECGAR